MNRYTHCSAGARLSLALFLSLGTHGCGSIEPQPGDLAGEAALGAIESKASALVLPKVTPIDGFTIPDALLNTTRAVIIRSTTDANTYLGSVPPGVDFTKEFLVLYSAGPQPTLGYKTSMRLTNVAVSRTPVGDSYRYQLKVTADTLLDPPGTGCAGELPGVGLPFTLVRVDATGLRDYAKVNTHSLSRSHTAYERTCYDPGAGCDGTLTAAGLAAIHARPATGGSVPIYATGRSYAQHYLGQYSVERWQEECTAGSCSWRKIIPPNFRYLDQGSLYVYTAGGDSHLIAFSGQGYETFYSGGGRTYPCWLWGQSYREEIDTRSGKGELSGFSITDNRTCSVATSANYSNKSVGMDGFSGVLGDHCVRLTSASGRAGIDTVLQVLTASW
jgi:hypothetical protein